MTKFLSVIVVMLSFCACAQNNKHNSSAAASTIDGIVNEVLKIVSGKEDKVRDWDAFRNLFLTTAKLSVLMHGDSSANTIESVTVEEFIESMDDEYYKQGFTEYELSKVVDEFNGLANVFQTYYGKDSENLEERGINSYQLVYLNQRWWIANLIWSGESEGAELPEKYLPEN